MADYIRREDAIRELNAERYTKNMRIHKRILDIPAADVRENVCGEWKHIGGDEWCCESCGYVISTEGSWEHPLEVGKCFCENCGADLAKSFEKNEEKKYE